MDMCVVLYGPRGGIEFGKGPYTAHLRILVLKAIRRPEDCTNIRIAHSASRAQDKGNTNNRCW